MAIAIIDSDAIGFADGNGGHAYTFPAGAPAIDDHDVLFINSNTIVSSVVSSGGAAWSQRVDATDQQGAYVYSRKATGGESNAVTVTTSGNFPTDLHWVRFSGGNAFSAGSFTRANNSNGSSLPATTTGVLAETGMALFAFGALHNFDGALATSPVWSNGFTAMESASNGSAGSSSAVVGFTGFKLNVGTGSETINSVTWTNDARNRYALWVAFTAAATADSISPTGISVPVTLGTPTLTDSSMTITPSGLSVPVALGPPTVAGPPGPAVDQLLLPVAEELLSCLCVALNSQPNPPGICCIRAGDETIQDMDQFQDECCEGMAYVRIDGFYPTGAPDAPFPSPSSDFALNKCAPYAWGLTMEMGVFRCIDSGILSCDDWGTVAALHMADAKAMRAALCCFMQPRDGGDVAVGAWSPKGRDGGCIGSIWQVTVMVRNACEGC